MSGEEKQSNLIFFVIISIAETTLKAKPKADKNRLVTNWEEFIIKEICNYLKNILSRKTYEFKVWNVEQ